MSQDLLASPADHRQFVARLGEELERCRMDARELAVLVVKLDRLPQAMQSLGSDAADRLLITLAERLYEGLQPKDLLARSGHDEFMLAVPEDQPGSGLTGQAERLAHQLLERVDRALQIDGSAGHVTGCAGIALFPDDAAGPLELLRLADIAMQCAKAKTGMRLERYRPGSERGQRSRFDLEGKLRTALDKRDMQVHYQPMVDLKTGRMVAAEALIRLPTSGNVMADTITVIALAQQSGLIGALDTHALTAACTQSRAWNGRAGGPQRIGVNISTNQFHEPDFVERVESVLAATGAEPRRLELELTEHALIEDFADAAKKLSLLRRKGLSIALDDFGTGYSSLTYLRKLPLDRIKIDGQFVFEMERDPASAAVVEAVILMGRAFGFEVVAEGVESAGQLALLRQHGCHFGQGYLFGRPVPAAELEQLMSRESLLPE